VSASGWGATATHAGSTRMCAVYVGTGGPIAPATAEGTPTCTP